jgi:hypothetical protein
LKHPGATVAPQGSDICAAAGTASAVVRAIAAIDTSMADLIPFFIGTPQIQRPTVRVFRFDSPVLPQVRDANGAILNRTSWPHVLS